MKKLLSLLILLLLVGTTQAQWDRPRRGNAAIASHDSLHLVTLDVDSLYSATGTIVIKSDVTALSNFTLTLSASEALTVEGKLVVEDSSRNEGTLRQKGTATFGATATPVVISTAGKVTASDTIVSANGFRTDGTSLLKGNVTMNADLYVDDSLNVDDVLIVSPVEDKVVVSGDVAITDDIDTYSFSVTSDKLSIYNDKSTPYRIFQIDSVGNITVRNPSGVSLAISAGEIHSESSSCELNRYSAYDVTFGRGGGNVSIGSHTPGTKLEIVDNNENAAHSLTTLLNDDEHATGETGQTIDQIYEFKATIDDGSNYTDQEAGKESWYKIEDYFHASDETNQSAGKKLYTVTDGSYVLNSTWSDDDYAVDGDFSYGGHKNSQEFTVNAFQYPNPGTDWTPELNGAGLAASLTAKVVWLPLNFLKIGDEIVSYKLVGDVTEAAAVTVDCQLYSINKADPITQTSITGGGIVQVDANGNFDVLATLSAVETVATDKQYVLQITGTTGIGDAITVMGAEVMVNRK